MDQQLNNTPPSPLPRLRFARVLLPTYFRKAKGVLMVFDMTNPTTLQSLETRWLSQMRDNADDEDLVKILIGNKCDLEHAPQIQNLAKTFASTNNMNYFETSALTGTDVSTAFESLLNAVHLKAISDKRSGTKREGNEENMVNLEDTKTKAKQRSKGCC